MNIEQFERAKPLVVEIEQLESEIERLPIQRQGGRKFRRILEIWKKKPFPTEKTYDGKFFVTTGYFDGGMIELNDSDVNCLIELRKRRIDLLNEQLNEINSEQND